MKKTICFLLAVLMLSTICLPAVGAADVPCVAAGAVHGCAGETVTVPIEMTGNPGVIAMRLFVRYDAEKLQLLDAADGGLFGSGNDYFGHDLTAVPYTLLWEDALSSSNYTQNGQLAVLTFRILDASPVGETQIEIALDAGSTFDVNVRGVTFTAQNGCVQIEEKAVYALTLDPNGGSVSPTSMTVPAVLPVPTKSYTITYDVNASDASVPTASKAVVCTFRNWNTARSGSGTGYGAGESFAADADVTLYAQWTNPTAGTLAAPSRSGFSFEGWFTSPTGGSKVADDTVISGNITLYAHWNAAAPVSCTLVSGPFKTIYRYREPFRPDGVALDITYSDGTTQRVTDTSEMQFEVLNPQGRTGRKLMQVTYKGVSATFEIAVRFGPIQILIMILLLGWLWY